MTDTPYSLQEMPDLCKELRNSFEGCLKSTFEQSKELRDNLAKFLNRSQEDSRSQLYQEASGECLLIFLENSSRVRLAWEEAQLMLVAGKYNTKAFIQHIAKKVVNCFVSKVLDNARDKDFAQLRQAIHRISTFITLMPKRDMVSVQGISEELDEKYMYYAPSDAITTDIKFDKIAITFEKKMQLKKFRAPSRDIRKLRSAPITKGGGKELIWDYDILEQEAHWFWQAFVDLYCKGIPSYVPEYALYYWLKCYIPALGKDEPLYSLDEPMEVGTDEELSGVRGDNLSATFGESSLGSDEGSLMRLNKDFAELTFEKDTLLSEAQAFAEGLSEREAKICAWYFGDDESLQSIATCMGLSGPSSVTRYMDHLKTRLQQHVTQFDNVTYGEFFVISVIEACQNLYPAPTGKGKEE